MLILSTFNKTVFHYFNLNDIAIPKHLLIFIFAAIQFSTEMFILNYQGSSCSVSTNTMPLIKLLSFHIWMWLCVHRVHISSETFINFLFKHHMQCLICRSLYIAAITQFSCNRYSSFIPLYVSFNDLLKHILMIFSCKRDFYHLLHHFY